jgi:hypothetical protein
MNMNLSEQLRVYGEEFDAGTSPVSLDELLRDTDSPVRVQPLNMDTRRPIPGWISAVAAAVVVLLIGGVALVLRDSGGLAAPAAPTSPTVAPTTVSPATAAPAVAGWDRVSDEGGVFGGQGRQDMQDVIVAGPGFVAVGSDSDDAAIWTSVDGSVWSRVPHDVAVFGNARIARVVTSGPVIVAVGTGGEPSGADRSLDAAMVWTSPDGISWSRLSHHENLFGDAGMSDIAIGGPGFVAVGSTYRDGNPDGDRDAEVWTSVDGISWSRVPEDETVFGGPKNQHMNSVTAGGPGLVAVGYDGTHGWDNPSGTAAVWTSVDGLVWSRVPHDDSVFGSNTAMVSVTAAGPGLVSVGYAFNCRPVWTSVDGLVWSRVQANVPGACNTPMRSVIANGEHLVAVGHGARSWSSADGVTWILNPDVPRLQRNDGQRMLGVTASDIGLVVVGFVEVDAGSESGDARVPLDADGDPVVPLDAAVWLQE